MGSMQRSSVFDFNAEGRDEIPGKHLATPILLTSQGEQREQEVPAVKLFVRHWIIRGVLVS